jgi:hypothetical protein
MPWKVIFPSQEVSLPRKALISSGTAGSFEPLLAKRDFAPDIISSPSPALQELNGM